jgi:hypothetical protein
VTTWILLTLGLSCATFVIVAALRHRIDIAELGTVSTRWLAEQRSQDHDFPNR